MKYVAFILSLLTLILPLSTAHAGSPLNLPAGEQVVMIPQDIPMTPAGSIEPAASYGQFMLDYGLGLFLLGVLAISCLTGWIKVKLKAHQRKRSIWPSEP